MHQHRREGVPVALGADVDALDDHVDHTAVLGEGHDPPDDPRIAEISALQRQLFSMQRLAGEMDGEIVARYMLPINMSFDHRVIDGADAARFCSDVMGYLEVPGRLLLEE